MRHSKKLLTRFTKLLLSVELKMYVQKQSVAILTAFSKYAACSHVSYQEQLPVWEVLGREIYTEYEKLYNNYKEEFEKLRQLGDEDDDIEELDSSESDKEEEEAAKKKPKLGLFGRKEKKEEKEEEKKKKKNDDDDMWMKSAILTASRIFKHAFYLICLHFLFVENNRGFGT